MYPSAQSSLPGAELESRGAALPYLDNIVTPAEHRSAV